MGRPLSDNEWETFKRIQSQSGPTDWSDRGPSGWRWTRSDRAACVGAVIAALVGVGLLLQWDFVFSAPVRIPAGIFVWLIALVYVGVWFMGIFQGHGGFWDWLGWLWWGFFWGVVFLVPFAVAGSMLLLKDRDYLTSDHEWYEQKITPAEIVGWGLILASVLLAVGGRPVRSSNR